MDSSTPLASSSGTHKKSRLESLAKKDLESQTKSVIMNVYNFVDKLADPAFLETINFKKRQEVTAEMCGVSLRSVQRCCQEQKNSPSGKQFSSPRRRYKRAKPQTELSDFDSNVVRQCVLEFYDRSEFPTAQRLLPILNEKIAYTGSARSLQRLLNNLGFRYIRSKRQAQVQTPKSYKRTTGQNKLSRDDILEPIITLSEDSTDGDNTEDR